MVSNSNLVPNSNRPFLDSQALLLLYVATFMICAGSHIFSYFGPMSSAYWWYLDGSFAWILGIARAFVAAALSTIGLWNMGFRRTESGASSGMSTLLPYKKVAFILGIISVVLLPILVLELGNKVIERIPNECADVVGDSRFARVWAPYIIYSIYVYGLWGVMFVYYFYCVIGCLIYDGGWLKSSRALILKQFDTSMKAGDGISILANNIGRQLQNHAEAIGKITRRYSIALMMVILVFLFEGFLTGTVSFQSQEWAETSAMVLILLFVCIIGIVFFQYCIFWNTMDRNFSVLKQNLRETAEDKNGTMWSESYEKIVLQCKPTKVLRRAFPGFGTVVPLGLSVFSLYFGDDAAIREALEEGINKLVPNFVISSIDSFLMLLGELSPYGAEVEEIEKCAANG